MEMFEIDPPHEHVYTVCALFNFIGFLFTESIDNDDYDRLMHVHTIVSDSIQNDD